MGGNGDESDESWILNMQGYIQNGAYDRLQSEYVLVREISEYWKGTAVCNEGVYVHVAEGPTSVIIIQRISTLYKHISAKRDTDVTSNIETSISPFRNFLFS